MLPSNINRSLFLNAYKRLPPITKSKKTASYFTITVSLLTLSFFGLFAIRPTLVTAITLIKNVSDLKKINIEYENKIGSIIKAQSEFEKIRDNLPLVENAIPTTPIFNKLANGLEKFAQSSNLAITQLQIDNVPISKLPSSSKLQKFGFNLIATGDYPGTLSFVQHLINWKRIVTISSLEIIKEGGAQNNLRVLIKGVAYYEP